MTVWLQDLNALEPERRQAIWTARISTVAGWLT